MSVLLTKLRGRVRSKIRSLDGKATGPDVVAVDIALCDAYIALQADLPQPTLYTANAVTISAGTDLFSLPVTVTSSGYGTGSEEYAGQVDLQRTVDGLFLRRYTVNELESWINGNVTTPLGIPERFALYEDNGQVVRGRCYPGAKSATVCNLYSTLHANDLRDWVGTGGSEGLETVSANLSRVGAAALVDYTAAMLVARMDADTLKKRGLNPQVATLWQQEADRLLYQEAARRNAIESNGLTQRRVS